MVELVSVLAAVVAVAAAGIAWRLFSTRDADQEGDARSLIAPAADGTIRVAVTNPGPEPVVVTACARPVGRLGSWGRRRVRRRRRQHERRNSWRAFRQLLGSVPPGGESTWIVVGDAGTPLCRVVLSLYQTAGRVRVHEAVVRTDPGAGRRLSRRDRLRTAPAS